MLYPQNLLSKRPVGKPPKALIFMKGKLAGGNASLGASKLDLTRGDTELMCCLFERLGFAENVRL